MKSCFHASFFLFLAFFAGFLGGCGRRSSAPMWNLPALMGKPMDAAQKTLGRPQHESLIAPGLMQSEWQRDDVTLLAKWKSSNRRVLEWNLVSRGDSQALRDGETAPLLVPGQLKENDPRYSTEWVEAASRPLFYIGVKVVPAPKNHAVVLRVSGSTALLQVDYQVGGKGDNLLTIPPWETTLTLPDDARVSLAANLYKVIGKEPFAMRVEIVADGKVVASNAASSKRAVSCSYEF